MNSFRKILSISLLLSLLIFSCKLAPESKLDEKALSLKEKIDNEKNYNITGKFNFLNIDITNSAKKNNNKIFFKGTFPLFVKTVVVTGETKLESNIPSQPEKKGKIVYTKPPIVPEATYTVDVTISENKTLKGKIKEIYEKGLLKSFNFELTEGTSKLTGKILKGEGYPNDTYELDYNGKKITGRRFWYRDTKNERDSLYYDFNIDKNTIYGKINFSKWISGTRADKNIEAYFSSNLTDEELFIFLFIVKMFHDFSDDARFAAFNPR